MRNKIQVGLGNKVDYSRGFMADARKVNARRVRGNWDTNLQNKLSRKVGRSSQYMF